MDTGREPLCEKDRDINDLVGDFGRWQFFYVGVSLLVFTMSAWWTFLYQFLAPDLKFNCSSSLVDDLKSHNLTNLTVSDDQCHINWENGTEKCDKWDYDHSFYTRTLTEKWNLVCDHYWMIGFFGTMGVLGDVTATPFMGYFSDKYGRKPVIIFSTFPAIVASILSLFAQNEIYFVIASFVFGFSGVTLYCVTFVYIMEIVGSKYRGELGMAVACGWTAGYITLPLVVWLCRDSFWIMLTGTIAGLLLIPLSFCVTESPRWLILHGRIDEASKILHSAMVKNGISTEELNERIDAVLEQQGDSPERVYTYLDLFRGPRLRKDVLLIYFYWFVTSFMYYGISLNASIFGPNALLNFTLFGLVEIPSNLVGSFVVHYTGRKKPMCFFMAASAVCCLTFIVIPKDVVWPKILVVVVGKFFVNGSFNLVYPYASERIPTACRATGICGGNIAGRLGGMLAPNVRLLSRYYGVELAMVIFGCFGFLASALSWLLPETKNKQLPETLEQAEQFGAYPDLVVSPDGYQRISELE